MLMVSCQAPGKGMQNSRWHEHDVTLCGWDPYAKKYIVLPKVKSETGKKAFAFQGANIFNKLTDDMKTETSILRFKTFCKKI